MEQVDVVTVRYGRDNMRFTITQRNCALFLAIAIIAIAAILALPMNAFGNEEAASASAAPVISESIENDADNHNIDADGDDTAVNTEIPDGEEKDNDIATDAPADSVVPETPSETKDVTSPTARESYSETNTDEAVSNIEFPSSVEQPASSDDADDTIASVSESADTGDGETSGASDALDEYNAERESSEAVANAPISSPNESAEKASARKITYAKSNNAVFTGKALTPKLVVKSGSQTLKLGRDYTVTYLRNVKAGKAVVIVKGIGSYTGTKKARFRIYKKPDLILGATKMPVRSFSTWIVKYAKLKVVSGKAVKVKGKGKKKTVTAIKTGTSRIAIYNLIGKRVKLKTIQVYKFYGAIYLKIGTNSALYLESTDDGRVKLSQKRNDASQQFLMEPIGAKTYRITNTATGKSLRAAYESGAYTSKIIQSAPSNAKAQKWKVFVDAKNRFSLVNAATKTAIGVANGNDKADVKPSLKKAALVDNKLFKPKALPVKCVTGATYMPVSSTSDWNLVNCKLLFRSGKGIAKFKDNTMTALKKGKAAVRIVNTMGKVLAEQQLRVYKLSSEYYLSSSVSPGRVVDVDAWLTEDGGNIILWDSTGLVNQKYKFGLKSDGSYRIKSIYSGNYLQVSNDAETLGNVEQWSGNSSNRQRWLIKVDSSNLLTFINKETGKAMALEGASKKRGTSIVSENIANIGSQKFIAVDLNQKVMKGKYNILSVYACRYSYSHPLYYQKKKSNTGTSIYKSVCGAIFPGYVQMSCDRGVATAARWSGVDIDYPAGTPAQYKYLMKSSDWKYLGHWNGKTSSLKPGDVLIRVTSMKDKYPNTKQNHTCVYVGTATALAVYNTYIKGTDGDLGSPTSDACFVSAHRSRDNKKNASAACIGNASFAHADERMVVFRCVNPNNSIKYSYLS